MTVPNTDSNDNQLLSELAAADGKLRNDSFESYMDVIAIFEHSKRRFKTGELVNDKDQQ
jgi:hypothetical protein